MYPNFKEKLTVLDIAESLSRKVAKKKILGNIIVITFVCHPRPSDWISSSPYRSLFSSGQRTSSRTRKTRHSRRDAVACEPRDRSGRRRRRLSSYLWDAHLPCRRSREAFLGASTRRWKCEDGKISIVFVLERKPGPETTVGRCFRVMRLHLEQPADTGLYCFIWTIGRQWRFRKEME